MGYNNRKLGDTFEKIACEYLLSNGYEILARNFRCRSGEIDIVAKDGGTIVFVEVKYRNSSYSGVPVEAVDGKKQMQISKTALFYLMTKGYNENTDCRFDVVAIKPGEMILIKNAFEFRTR